MSTVFDHQSLREVGRLGHDLPVDEMVETIVAELRRRFGRHVSDRPPHFIPSIAGGITGVMTILHASLSEYLLIFGTPVGTEGFSGRYHIDIWDYVIAGRMHTYFTDRPGSARMYAPGEDQLLARGKVKGVTLAPGTWLLEYGRGPIITSLPMALGDSVFSALDGTTIVQTFKEYGRLSLQELLLGKL